MIYRLKSIYCRIYCKGRSIYCCGHRLSGDHFLQIKVNSIILGVDVQCVVSGCLVIIGCQRRTFPGVGRFCYIHLNILKPGVHIRVCCPIADIRAVPGARHIIGGVDCRFILSRLGDTGSIVGHLDDTVPCAV